MYQQRTTATLAGIELCVSPTQSKNGVTVFTFAGASSEAVKWSSSREVLNWQRKFLLHALVLAYFYHYCGFWSLLLLLNRWPMCHEQLAMNEYTKSRCYPILLTLRNLHAGYEPSLAIGSKDELQPQLLGLPLPFIACRMQWICEQDWSPSIPLSFSYSVWRWPLTGRTERLGGPVYLWDITSRGFQMKVDTYGQCVDLCCMQQCQVCSLCFSKWEVYNKN
jgi:hypothetical protein